MTSGDIRQTVPLLAELGYELMPDEVERRFAAIIRSTDHSLLVAEMEAQIVGLLHLYARPALEKPPETIVQALVVDRAFRGGGVGRALMAAAERWASERGYRSVALSSNIAREEAHRFYAALGYRPVATSCLLRKELSAR
jgi:GNAT superfamily N-acetyltransferase